MRSSSYVSVYPPYQLLNAWPIYMKLGVYIMATEPISTAYVINSSHQSVSLYMHPSYRCKAMGRLSASVLSLLGNGSVNTFPQQRIHATIEELLDAPFSLRSVSFKGESVGLSVYPPIVAPAATNNCWRFHFLCGPCCIEGNMRLILSRTSCFLLYC
jgi:hypothetical protein